MGKRKSSASVTTGSPQRARLESTRMSPGDDSSGNVAASHNLDAADDLIAQEQASLENISGAADGCDDVLASAETTSAHEDVVMPGQPLETQMAEIEQLKESDFYVSLNVCKMKQRSSDHLNFGRLQLHPNLPSEAFCIALNEDSRWSTEVWIYVRGTGECTLYAEMKIQSNGKRKRTNCLVEHLPGRVDSESLSLLTAISEQPDGKQLVKLMWQRPATTARAAPTTDDGSSSSQQLMTESIVATVLVSQQAYVDTSSVVRTLLGSQRKAIRTALNCFFPSAMQRRNQAKGIDGELYLSQTVNLYKAVAAYNANAQHCLDGKIEEASVTCRERGLLPVLRAYQWRAIRWMLGRENAPGWGDEKSPESDNGDGDGLRGVADDQAMSRSYRLYDFAATFQRLEDLNGVGFYVHTASGALSGTPPKEINLPLGGVLADEMGLGKTLEVLGCILLHPRPSLPGKASAVKMINNGTDAIIDAAAADVCGHSADEWDPAALSAKMVNNGTEAIIDASAADVYRHSAHECGPAALSAKMVNNGTDAIINAAAAEACGHSADKCGRTALSVKMVNNGADAIIDAAAADACEDSAASPLELRTFFECSCWQKDDSCDNKERVHCVRCGVIQHAECMAYDLALHKEPYMCPYCLLEVDPIRSKTTLIVVPETIVYQWQVELIRHVSSDSLNFTVYEGASSQKYVQPLTLCSYDIVITTYEILCKELRFTNLRRNTDLAERRLGKPKRFTAMPSPLKAIQWWRICLDEAQMVESTTTKTAEMALMLHAVNRWCVTGTPVQHSLQDLYGLLLFLGVQPFYAKRLWQLLLYEPHVHGLSEELYDVVSRLMWRSSKADVANELALPPVTFSYNYLIFQPIEDYFYRQLSQDCRKRFNGAMRNISDWKLKPNSLAKLSREQVMEPLRELLRACCHPLAVHHYSMQFQQTALTMEEVAHKLERKAVKECEELHRNTVFHQLGLAGLYILKNEPASAVRVYRDVLKSAEVHLTKEVRTDDLQILHTVYNLRSTLQMTAADSTSDLPSTSAAATALQACTESISEQQKLLQKEREIRNRYSKNSHDAVNRAREEWRSAKEHVNQLTRKLSPSPNWWAAVIETCIKFSCDVELVDDVCEALRQSTEHFGGFMCTTERFSDARGMMLAVELLLSNLSDAYRAVTEKLEMLSGLEPGTPEFGDLMQAANKCCIRPEGTALKLCHFCTAMKLLSVYETKVFCYQERRGVARVDKWATKDLRTILNDTEDLLEVDAPGLGTWKPSEGEVMLNALLTFCHKRFDRVGALDDIVLKASENHLNLFKAWRTEFKPLRALWVALYQRARTSDELEMAVERLQLCCDASDGTTGNVKQQGSAARSVHASNVPKMINSTLADLNNDQRQLSAKMRNLQYLRHFVEDSRREKLDLCGICLYDLSKEGWIVLPCGHYFCIQCMLHTCDAVGMLRQYINTENSGASSIKKAVECPKCRASTPISQLTTVRPTASGSNQVTSWPDNIDVKGDLSSKMRAIVRCVKDIFSKDQQAKIIVISECLQIQCTVQHALCTNDIDCVFLNHHAHLLQKEGGLEKFKTGAVNVLLLPLPYGVAGLNLVEASHILFPSPILNPALEFQAIGRIHRIGQTKPTYVHYFIMKDTVEAALYAAVKKSVEIAGSNCQFAATDDIPLTLQDIANMLNDGN